MVWQLVDIAAPQELVFDVIATPYLGRQSRAIAEKVRILERGTDMVLAAHKTPVHGGRLTATTVETVRFVRPGEVHFSLVRGPVPYVVEQFTLTEESDRTRLAYRGELGTDLWALGAWWGRLVGRSLERAVAASFEAIKAEAERRHRDARVASFTWRSERGHVGACQPAASAAWRSAVAGGQRVGRPGCRHSGDQYSSGPDGRCTPTSARPSGRRASDRADLSGTGQTVATGSIRKAKRGVEQVVTR